MPVRFLQMQSRDAGVALIAALLLVPPWVAPAAAASWSAPARPAGCALALSAAAAPSVVFPSANPTARSGPGALLWTAPRGCAEGSSGAKAGEAFGATLVGDTPGVGQPLAPDAMGLEEVAATAGTASGQVVAVGSGALTEGRTAGAFGAAQPLGGPAAPVTASSAYLGDVAIASPVRTGEGWAIAVRVQRHYRGSPARARLVAVGARPVDAVAATMDYRADVLLVWASGGTVHARELSPTGALGPAQRLGSVPAGSPGPELRAVLSDDGHAIVAWRSQSGAPRGAPVAPSTTIELSISGSGLAFGAPRVLERYRDPGGFVSPAGSLRLLRLSSEAVMIAWTGVDAGRYVVRASPVSLRRGAWAPVVISGLESAEGPTAADRPTAARGPTDTTQPTTADGQTYTTQPTTAEGRTAANQPTAARGPTDTTQPTAAEGQTDATQPTATPGQTSTNGPPTTDAVLADLSAGPDAEAFALWRVAPSLAGGAPNPLRWAIRAAHGHYAGQGEVSFAPSELLAAPGPNGPPKVAVDPASGGALAAWVTLTNGDGVGRIEYALRAPTHPAAPASAIPATALACCMGLPYASIDNSAIRIGTPLAACLK